MWASAAPLQEDELRAGMRVGDYEILARIGAGGMATVYAGLHPVIGRKVAIKVIRRELCASSDALERFIQEARAVVAIGHPNIVDVFTFGTLEDGRGYYVMEQLEGRTLAEWLDADGALPLEPAASILASVCEALHAAHRAGIVHRDLKPQNVFITDRGTVKLLDFGIAKLIGRAETGPRTRPGTALGTPDYISPEQARGREVDPSADIYSLGVMAFEMVTGELPFIADNAADLLVAHLEQVPMHPAVLRANLPEVLDRLIAAMLAKNPSERPGLGEVLSVLASLGASPRVETHSRPRRGRRLALVVLGVAWGVAAWLMMGSGRSLPLARAVSALLEPGGAGAPSDGPGHGAPVPSPPPTMTAPLPPTMTAPPPPMPTPPSPSLARDDVARPSSSVPPSLPQVLPAPMSSRGREPPRARPYAKIADDFHTIDPWRGRR